MRDINERFLMIPISLLEIPEFVRHFDSKPVGSLYRVLCSRIWRQPREGLRKNSSERIKNLTNLFESGYLASMHTLESLSEAVGYHTRSVRRELNALEYLGLIKVKKVNKETFYVVGESNPKGNDGYGMGASTEALYLNRWRDFVNYSSEYAPEKLDAFKEDIVCFFKDGQICHDLLTNLSKISTFEDMRNVVLDKNSFVDEPPLIDKGINNSNSSSDFSSVEKTKNDVIQKIKSLDHKKAITESRKALREETLTLSQVKKVLSFHIPESYSSFSNTPMFALRLYEYENFDEKTKEHVKLANLWVSLREDFTGITVVNTAKEFSKLVGISKNILGKFSFNQVVWTIKKVAVGNKNDLEFLSEQLTRLEFFVKKYAKEYQDIREARLRNNESKDKIKEFKKKEDLDYETSLLDSDDEDDEDSSKLMELLGW